jgi:hypothetical protein
MIKYRVTILSGDYQFCHFCQLIHCINISQLSWLPTCDSDHSCHVKWGPCITHTLKYGHHLSPPPPPPSLPCLLLFLYRIQDLHEALLLVLSKASHFWLSSFFQPSVPWGFQSSVCLSVTPCGLRSVWPVQCHLLSFTCYFIDVCFILCHNSSSEILSSHFVFRIHCRHRFTDLWSELLIHYFPCFTPVQYDWFNSL